MNSKFKYDELSKKNNFNFQFMAKSSPLKSPELVYNQCYQKSDRNSNSTARSNANTFFSNSSTVLLNKKSSNTELKVLQKFIKG